MQKSNKGDEPKKRKGDDADKEPPKDRERPPPPRNPDADPVKIHRDYVERRIGRGAPPSPEAYARALEQWHQLPGAVSTPPSEVKGENVEETPNEGESAESEGADPKTEGRR